MKEFLIWLKDVGPDAWLIPIAAKSIITIMVIRTAVFGLLKIYARFTPSKKDDAAIAQLERVSDDVFQIVQPKKPDAS